MIIETIVLVLGLTSVVSTETTGKGLADHAISSINNKDCKIARVIHNEQVCQNEPKGVVTISAPTLPMAGDTISRTNDVFAERARRSRETR